MAKNTNNNLFSITLVLSLLLLATTFTNACDDDPCKPKPKPYNPTPSPPKPLFCPLNTLKLGVCVNILGIGNNVVGGVGGLITSSSSTSHCCVVLQGLSDLEVAACLCTALKANVLGLNLGVNVAMSALVSTCHKTIPPGFKCV